MLYTDEMVKEFAAAIAAPQRTLPSADRAGVVDDVCATFFSGDFTGAEGLSSLLSALKMEEELEVSISCERLSALSNTGVGVDSGAALHQ